MLGTGTYRLVGKRDKSFWPRMVHAATWKVQGVMGTHRWDPQPTQGEEGIKVGFMRTV